MRGGGCGGNWSLSCWIRSLSSGSWVGVAGCSGSAAAPAPPKIAISALVNSLKGVSSRRLRQMRPELVRRYWKGVLWSPSYFSASCGGAPISIIRQYIEQQRTPD